VDFIFFFSTPWFEHLGIIPYPAGSMTSLWRAGYAPGDRLTSWVCTVYSTTFVQYLYVYKLLFI
jgi:hypothetical protein